MRAIIISDTHIGARNCEAALLLIFLREVVQPTDLLVICGDFVDDLNFNRLKPDHWRILQFVKERENTVFVRGNHDGYVDNFFDLTGILFRESFTFKSGDSLVTCIHGDQFDTFTSKHPALCNLADLIYRGAQWLDSSHSFAKFLKHSSKQQLRSAELVKSGAIQQFPGSDVVICGHTHIAEASPGYFNAGCWTEKPCHFVEVCDGQIQLKTFI